MKARLDFTDIIKREFEARLTRNNRYSLRAFARDLKVAPAVMSDVLNKKRGLSRASARSLAKNLGLNRDETNMFCDLVESKHARSKAARQNALVRLKSQKSVLLRSFDLNQKSFEVVSEWYHFPILELLKTRDCIHTPLYIARRLGLHLHQVQAALERMQQLGLIVYSNNRFLVKSDVFRTPDGVPSHIMKQHHEQFLKKAIAAIYTQHLDERDFRGLSIKCSIDDVSYVRDRLREFLLTLDRELSQNQDANEVYQLSTQFFRLTTNHQQEEK